MGGFILTNSWRAVALQIHVDTPMIPLIKIKLELKTERYYIKIKLHRNPTSKIGHVLIQNGFF